MNVFRARKVAGGKHRRLEIYYLGALCCCCALACLLWTSVGTIRSLKERSIGIRTKKKGHDDVSNASNYDYDSDSDSDSDSNTKTIITRMFINPTDANSNANLSHGTNDETSHIDAINNSTIGVNHADFGDSTMIIQQSSASSHQNIARSPTGGDRNSTDSDWDDNKPYFIVHIGPSKTGTTTIQKESVALEDVLARDDYVYMGKFSKRKYQLHGYRALKQDSCLFETESYLLNNTGKDHHQALAMDVPCWNERMTNLQQFHKNVVVSEEAYSFSLLQKLLNAISTAFRDWNLLYVVTYRRYAEWMLSALKQKHYRVQCVGEKSKWYVNATRGGRLCLEPMHFLNWKQYNKEVISNYGTDQDQECKHSS